MISAGFLGSLNIPNDGGNNSGGGGTTKKIHVSTSGGVVERVDVDGTVDWSNKSFLNSEDIEASDQRNVFVAKTQGNGWERFNPDGQMAWSVGSIGKTNGLGLADTNFYGRVGSNNAVKVKKSDGNGVWTRNFSNNVGIVEGDQNGNAYVSVGTDVLKLNPDSSTNWTFGFSSAASVSSYFRNGTLYVGQADNLVRALDAATGNEIWANMGPSTPIDIAVDQDGDVYALSQSSLRKFNQNGLIWTKSSGISNAQAIDVSFSKKSYVGIQDTQLSEVSANGNTITSIKSFQDRITAISTTQ